MSHQWFDELAADSRRTLDGLLRKSTPQSLRRILVEKYADPEHFIYELIQNADDQHASTASIRATPTQVQFEHDGSEFRAKDVAFITAISLNEKADDPSKIGKYGLGFKSVLNITARPEIYTTIDREPFSFAIEDIIVPVPQPDPTGQSRAGRTLFKLPYQLEGREDIRSRVERRLPAVGAEVLLFLNHVHTLQWSTPHAQGTLTKRTLGKDRVILGSEIVEGGEKQSFQTEYRFLRKRLTHPSADSELEVAIALRIIQGAIQPEAETTKLNVFFPTEVETNLRFLIHGPFLLNDSRENILRENHLNTSLMEACAQLLAESLEKLREERLLTLDALSAMPIQLERATGSISETWRPIYKNEFSCFYEQCVSALRSQALVPTASGEHCRASEARIAESERIFRLLDDSQLTDLFDSESALHWLDPAVTERGAYGVLWRFLRYGLGVFELTSRTLATRLSSSFLAKQQDAWFKKLYAALDVMTDVWKTPQSELRCRSERPIILLENGELVPPFNPDNPNLPCAFLPPDQEVNSSAPIVKRELFSDPAAAEFLKNLGLTQRSIVEDVIEEVLPSFEGAEPDLTRFMEWLDEYKFNLEVIADAVRNCQPARVDALREGLLKQPIVFAYSAADESMPLLRRLSEVCEPTDELKVWFEGVGDAFFVSEEISDSESWKAVKGFVEKSDLVPTRVTVLARNASAVDGYTVLGYSDGRYRRGVRGFDPDATIFALKKALSHPTESKARLLWNILLEHWRLVRGVVEAATWRNYGNAAALPEELSYFGRLVLANAWLPDASGEFYTPDVLSLRELPDDFECDSAEAKHLAKALRMQLSDLDEIASRVEVDTEELALFLRHKDDPRLKSILVQLDLAHADGFPSEEVPDPNRRALRIEEEFEQAQIKEYEERVRSVRTSASAVSERKLYLRQIYSNDEGRVTCQLCHLPMPFRALDGQDYFEAVMLFRRPIVDKEIIFNYLALCPLCAAKFLYARRTTDSHIANELARDPRGLDIQLADITMTLRFAPSHALDLGQVIGLSAVT